MGQTRRPFVGGNWKMNWDRSIVADTAEVCKRAHAEVVVFPPAAFIHTLRTSHVTTGAQSVYHEARGAYTGEHSAAIVREAGASWALCGHSERRTLFGEDDAAVSRKARAIVAAGLGLVLCIGETLGQHEAGETRSVLSAQLRACVDALREGDASRVVVAYEPVWAIGTGRAASPTDVSDAHAHIRRELRAMDVSDAVRVIYGGSVTASNASALFAVSDVDGFLVGGASLKPQEFAAIIDACDA